MYNLFISANKNQWNGDPFILEMSRCIREYTDTDITEKYGDFSEKSIKQIKKFPCIFGYESGCKIDPKFGLIREIVKRQGQIRITYEIINLEKFLNYLDLNEMLFALDISRWEINRTHWAMKNVNLQKELTVKGIKLPDWANKDLKAVDISTHKFNVAFSFPGEVRGYVESVAIELEREMGPNSYFYDNNYRSQLARPSLDTLLQDIYRKRSKLVVVFLCEKYQEKEWCGIEFRAIKEIIMERKDKRIMFIKMDNGKVDGVFKTDGYIDGRIFTPKEIADFIKQRVELI